MRHSVHQNTYPNGASVHFITIEDSPVVEAKISFKCGFLQFDAEKYHVPHMLEHLLLSKSQRFADESSLTRYLQRLGAQANASTTFDELAVVLRAPATSFPEAFRAVWDSVFGATPDEELVEHERDVIRREIFEQFDNMQSHLNTAVFSEIFKEYPSSLEEHLEGLDDLVHDDIKKAYEQFIVADGTKVIISGTLTLANKSTIKGLVKALRSVTKTTGLPVIQSALNKPLDNKVTCTGIPADQLDSGFLLMHFVIPAHPDRSARATKTLATALMFDSPAAIVPASLRSRGLIYSWDTDVIQLDEVDVYTVSITTNKSDLQTVVGEVVQLLAKNAYDDIDVEALADVKSFVELNLPTLQETSGELLQWYETDIRHGFSFIDLNDEVSMIHSETIMAVQSSIRRIFFEGDMYISVVGGPAVTHWSHKLKKIIIDAKSSSKPVDKKIDEFLKYATQEKTCVAQGHPIFFALHPIIMWISLAIALRLAYLPYKNNPTATASMFDAAYDQGHWLWAACLFLPLFTALIFTFFQDTRPRTLIASILYAISSGAYIYGLFAYFGDFGKSDAPFWQDVASIIHPVTFLILTPLALFWATKYFIAERQAHKEAAPSSKL